MNMVELALFNVQGRGENALDKGRAIYALPLRVMGYE